MKTLSETLGETTHVSPLMRKFRRLGFGSPKKMTALAVVRGCSHYQQESEEVTDPGTNKISNAELVVGLLLGEHKYDPMLIRIDGQLISGVEDTNQLRRLAIQERVGCRLRYIAEKGKEVEPENSDWKQFCEWFPQGMYQAGLLPHTDRFTTDLPRSRLDSPRRRKWLRVSR